MSTGFRGVALSDRDYGIARHVPGLKVRGDYAYGQPDAMHALHLRGVNVPERLRTRLTGALVEMTEANVFTGKLRDYQLEGVARMLACLYSHGGFLLADEQGLGKTAQTLAAICTLPKTVALVVAPKSAVYVWEDEANKFSPALKPRVLIRSGYKPLVVPDASELDAERLIITNYEALPKFPVDWSPGILAMDEVQYVKNFKAARSERLAALSRTVPFKIGLSGTPFWSQTQDYWNTLNILFGNIWGSRTAFGMAYAGAFLNEHRGLSYEGGSPEGLAELKERLAFYSVRRLKTEVAKELPPKTRQIVWVDSTSNGRQYLHRLRYGAHSQTYADALKDCGDGKIDAAVELASVAKRFLCITYRKDHARELVGRMTKEGLTVRLIDGDVPHEERRTRIRDMEAQGGGIVGTIDVMNVALNLQKLASVGIMHSIDPIPAKILQAEDRIHRIGSPSPVTWYYLAMKDSIDQMIMKKVVQRLDQMMGVQGKGGLEGLAKMVEVKAKPEGEVIKELLKDWGE
jgi:SNF2 family DNA or RNA helicase